MISKNELTTNELMIVQSEFEKKKKSKGVAFLIWFFLGGLGGHRFYLGDTGRGVAMLFLNYWMTLGIWSLIDAFFISQRVDDLNKEIEEDILRRLR